MKFYAAGKFQEYTKVRTMVDLLVFHGHEVTYDWTRTDEFGSDGHPKQTDPHNLDKRALQRYADADVQGVKDADFLVVCADGPLCGAWIEMGVAIATERCHRIFVIAPERWTIFLELAKVTVVPTYNEFHRMVREGL